EARRPGRLMYMTERIPPRDPSAGTAVPASADPADHGDSPPPPRFAFDSHTWREVAHLLANLPCSLVGFTYVATVMLTGLGLPVTVIGFRLLAVGLLGARLLGSSERRRARLLLGVHVDEPSRLPLHGSGGFWPRLWLAVKDPVGWRAVLYESV